MKKQNRRKIDLSNVEEGFILQRYQVDRPHHKLYPYYQILTKYGYKKKDYRNYYRGISVSETAYDFVKEGSPDLVLHHTTSSAVKLNQRVYWRIGDNKGYTPESLGEYLSGLA